MIAIVWLHVTSMMLGFTALMAYDTVFIVSSKSRSAQFIIRMLRGSSILGIAGKLLVVGGILSGLHLAQPFGHGSAWLVASYALVAIAMVLGVAVLDPARKRLLVAATTGDKQVAIFHPGSLPIAVLCINTLCWAGVLWLMLAKP